MLTSPFLLLPHHQGMLPPPLLICSIPFITWNISSYLSCSLTQVLIVYIVQKTCRLLNLAALNLQWKVFTNFRYRVMGGMKVRREEAQYMTARNTRSITQASRKHHASTSSRERDRSRKNTMKIWGWRSTQELERRDLTTY